MGGGGGLIEAEPPSPQIFFFLLLKKIINFSSFPVKWPKSGEKHEFGGRLVATPLQVTPSPLPAKNSSSATDLHPEGTGYQAPWSFRTQLMRRDPAGVRR